MSSAPKAIGLLGGTFDPVHNGHVSIVNSYLNSGYIDHLIVVLTPYPPHKGRRKLTDFEHRLNMLKISLSCIENLTISTIESELPKPSYTINTIDYLNSKYPDIELYLCIGEDSLSEFKSWYRWEAILSKCTLLVAKRPETISRDISDDLKQHIHFIDHDPVDISSSEIRKKISSGKDIRNLLPAEVLRYITEHHLYQN